MQLKITWSGSLDSTGGWHPQDWGLEPCLCSVIMEIVFLRVSYCADNTCWLIGPFKCPPCDCEGAAAHTGYTNALHSFNSQPKLALFTKVEKHKHDTVDMACFHKDAFL